mgnify:CR=1 FL=1
MNEPASTRPRRLRRWIFRLSLGTAVAGALTCGTWSLVRARVGDPADRLADDWHAGHRVLDRHGRLLRELTSDTGVRGQPLELEAIGPRLVQATLTSEDAHFFEHGGNVTVGGKRKSACIVGIAGVRKVSMARRNPGMASPGPCAAGWRTCVSSPS